MTADRIRLIAAVMGCCVAPAGFAGAAPAQSRPEDRPATSEQRGRPPSELWQEFPLGEPTRPPATAPRDRVPRPAEPAAFEPEGEELSSGDLLRLLLLLTGLAALVLLGPAIFILVRPPRRTEPAVAGAAPRPPPGLAAPASREEGAYVARQRERLLVAMDGPGTTQERVQAACAVAIGALEPDIVSPENGGGRERPVEERIVSPASESDQGSETAGEQEPASFDATQVGDRVAAVLRAAEEAAQQIRAEAQAAAHQMMRRAEQVTKTRLEETREEAERMRAEAQAESESVREAAQVYARNHRRAAEESAARALDDAEAEAQAAREAAEAMVQRIEESARSLEEEVREQERMIRGRMQRYLAGLRDASGQIEAVLRETERDAPPLVEALAAERAKANAHAQQG